MIAFDLICSQGHKFECWFRSGKAFDEQKAFRLIHCPICNNTHVEKAISSFAIKKYSDRREEDADKKEEGVDPHRTYQALQVITEYLNKNFEDVGLDFAKEALKIHWGESKERKIKGVALPDEEKILKEEGVPFLKIPVLKRRDN